MFFLGTKLVFFSETEMLRMLQLCYKIGGGGK